MPFHLSVSLITLSIYSIQEERVSPVQPDRQIVKQSCAMCALMFLKRPYSQRKAGCPPNGGLAPHLLLPIIKKKESIDSKEGAMRRTDMMTGTTLLREMTALHLMERAVAFFKSETRCDALLSAMVNGNFGSVPIVDDAMRLIGIVSEYDLLDALFAGVDITNLSAEEIMQHPYSVSLDCSAMEIGRFIQQNHFIRVPVVDRENRLVGMVARRDLLNGYLEELIGPDEGF